MKLKKWVEDAGARKREGMGAFMSLEDKYGWWGDPCLEKTWFLELQRTVTATPQALCYGITVKRIGVPEAQRRQKIATKLVRELHDVCMLNGLDYLKQDGNVVCWL